MPENTASTKANAGTRSDRPMTQGAGAAREFAQQGADFTKDVSERTAATAQQTGKAFEQAYSTVAKGAAEFNAEWIEMLRVNINSHLDFAHQLTGVKSPSEYLELSAAHTRNQFEVCTKQAQHLAGLAQKVTTDAIQPLQTGVANAFTKMA